jgi:hypothetical protein
MKAIALATEDELSECVGVKLANEAGLEVNMMLRKNGNGYLRSSIEKFITMTYHQPLLLITDLDTLSSPTYLQEQWVKQKVVPPGLLFHVAVREVEAWLLADHEGMKKLLGAKINKLPSSPELLPDPKRHLLGLAAKASREVRNDLVAERNSMASQGLGYNSRLTNFVRTMWKPSVAAELSPSLAALRTALSDLG